MFEESVHDDVVGKSEGFIQKNTESLPAHFVWSIARILASQFRWVNSIYYNSITVILLKIWTNLSISVSDSFVFLAIFSVNFSILFLAGKLLTNAVVMISTVWLRFYWSDSELYRSSSSNNNNFFFPKIFSSFGLLLFFSFWITFNWELWFVVIFTSNTSTCFAEGKFLYWSGNFKFSGNWNIEKLMKMRFHTGKELSEVIGKVGTSTKWSYI